MSHLTRCYVSCFLCWGRHVLTGLYGAFLWRQPVRMRVKHLWLSQCFWDCIWPPHDFFPWIHLQSINSFLSIFYPLFPLTLLFFLLFLPCSVYLYRSSLLVGLVFPTFSLYGTRRGVRLERKARQWSGLGGRKRRWMQNRLRDGGREGAKTVPEQGNGELD